MSKSKVVREIVEHVAPATKGAKAAEKLRQPITRAAARRAIDDIMQEHNASVEYMVKNADVDPVPDEAYEAVRRQYLVDPSVDPSFDFQARTPEEYAERLPQFRDPQYAQRASLKASQDNMPNPEDIIPVSEERWMRWLDDNKPVYNYLKEDRKLARAVRSFADEGVYKASWLDPRYGDDPLVWWHSDVYTDPRLDQLGFIQFNPAAREFGFHAGSKQASQDIMASKEVMARKKRELSELTNMFEQLDTVTNGEASIIFRDAFRELRTNKFLRAGERAFETPSVGDLGALVDEWFEIIATMAEARQVGDMFDAMTQLSNVGNANLMKGTLVRWMQGTLDPTTIPFVTNVKQGLHVRDLGNNTAAQHAQDLIGRGLFNDDTLSSIAGMSNQDANIALKDLLESKGYDHLIMHNGAEDSGLPSIVLWKEDSIMPLWGKGSSISPNRSNRLAYSVALAPLAVLLGLGEEDADLRTTE